MKKILIGLLLFVAFVFPVSAQFDDIQKDEVRVDQFVENETSNFQEVVGEHIKSFKSDILINKDGRINVKETIVYDFGQLQKHGIYRDVPFIRTNQDGKKYKLEFNNFSVQDENGKGYRFTTSSIDEKIIRLKIGDPDRLISGIYNYIITYTVEGALTYFSDHDELYWNITGNEWTVPIVQASALIRLPEVLESSNLKIAC